MSAYRKSDTNKLDEYGMNVCHILKLSTVHFSFFDEKYDELAVVSKMSIFLPNPLLLTI